ncbi:MFS transporter [PVC group bacterium]|nr:MFS transporter [PVC group bacterium]
MNQPNSLKSKGFRSLLVTQFLGAFNDNAFKLVILLLAVKMFADQPGTATTYIALAGAIFILPFIIFSAYAGYFADRYSKKRIIVLAKFAEAAVMILGLIAFLAESIPLMLGVLFLMGTQSAFFSPAKYGILPEIMDDEELSQGNGQMQLWTFIAIILGTAIGGQLLDLFSDPYKISFVFIAISVIGIFSSFFVTDVQPAGSPRAFQKNFLKDMWMTLREVKKEKVLFLCIMGSAFFWFLGAIYQMNIVLYAKTMMGLSDSASGILLTGIALGVGVGSVLAGKWSGEKIEFGLVPLGAIGLGVTSILIGFSYESFFFSLLLFFLLGMNFGFFNIPLTAYIQQKSPRDSKGRVIAANNFVSFCSMILSSLVLLVLRNFIQISPAGIFVILGLASFVVIIYICKLLPDFLTRFLVWLLTHTFYRIRMVGRQNVPKEGGALLVCNHVSYVDGFIVTACIQRFIRMMLAREFYDIKFLNPLFRAMKVIPISPKDGPKKMAKSLEQASEYLRQGELVCIFAEGGITRTGNMLPFGKGLERVMRHVDVPIIPVHLGHVWGSIFSFERGKFLRKIPRYIPYPVTVSFGKPMNAKSKTYQVRQTIEELGAEAFRYRKDEQETLPFRFYRQARMNPFKFCMADSGGKKLNYIQALIGTMALSKAIRRRCTRYKMIGIMLPSSVVGTLVNIAISMLGKVPVNLNFTSSEEALAKAIEKCDIKFIFTSRELREKLNIKKTDMMIDMEDFKSEVRPVDRWRACFDMLMCPFFILKRLYMHTPKVTNDDLATVIFSSGSTGDPKGVMLSHANINSNIEGLYQVFHAEKNDIVLGILPLFHSFGFTGTLWYPLTTGIGVVYHSNPLDFKTIGEIAGKYKTTILMATPTFLMGYIRRCTPEQFRYLRQVVVGAEKLKERIAESFKKRFNIAPLEAYGCTELSPIVSLNIPDVQHGKIHQVGHKPGTIGHPIPGVAVKIVDPDTFEEKAINEEGMLLVKGQNVMQGYLKDDKKTKEVMHDGWYITGDIALVDNDGFITIKDRLSRFSKIAGEMVPHICVEEEIHQALGVTEEQVCVVTSVPDERKGEALAVLYKGDIDIESLWEKLNASELPRLWVPKKEYFYQIEKIPVLGSGKLDLKKIKTLAQEKFLG